MSEATSAVMVIRSGSKFLTVPHLDGACCPGGKREPADRTTEQTAIRETMEEAGFIIKKCTFVFQATVGDHLCDCYYATDWVDASNAKDGSKLWHLARWVTREGLVSNVPGEVRFPAWNAEMLRQIEAMGLVSSRRRGLGQISDTELTKMHACAPLLPPPGAEVAYELIEALQVERALRSRVTRYEFGPLTLERRGSEDSWAICSGGTEWTRAGHWEHEAPPSSHDRTVYLMRARWTFEEALRELMKHLRGEPVLGRLRLKPRRASMSRKARHGETNGRARFPAEEVALVRSLLAGGKTRREIAILFGVHVSTIGRIANGTTWQQQRSSEVSAADRRAQWREQARRRRARMSTDEKRALWREEQQRRKATRPDAKRVRRGRRRRRAAPR